MRSLQEFSTLPGRYFELLIKMDRRLHHHHHHRRRPLHYPHGMIDGWMKRMTVRTGARLHGDTDELGSDFVLSIRSHFQRHAMEEDRFCNQVK